jgi:hypothetical protein
MIVTNFVVRVGHNRVSTAITTHFGWKLYQMDIESAFLDGDLKEEVYIYKQWGFQLAGKEHLVCRFMKALYKLKQAPKI